MRMIGAAAVLAAVVSTQAAIGPVGALPGGSDVTGRVTDAASGAPLGGICVHAEWTSIGDSIHQRDAVSGPDGTYSFDGTGDGNPIDPPHWRVQFQDCAGIGPYATEWYDDAADAAQATAVPAGAEGVDAALEREGALTGTVVDDAGQPIADACVRENDTWQSTTTGPTGGYTLAGLKPGPHVVLAYDCQATPRWVTEYYNQKASASDADAVLVAAGATTSGIDFSLDRMGTISATVVDQDTGAPIADMCVRAGTGRDGRTDANGNATATAVPPGNVRVQIFDCSQARHDSGRTYIAEWYEDAPDLASAEPVVVAPGADVALGVLQVASICSLDEDGDGLDHCEEDDLGTSPTNADSDADGFGDGAEVAFGTDPTSPDTDGDGLGDGDEGIGWGTDARRWDSDGDGWSDGTEVRGSCSGIPVGTSSPSDPGSIPPVGTVPIVGPLVHTQCAAP